MKCLFLLFLFSAPAGAYDVVSEPLKLFQKGAYAQAIAAAEKVKPSNEEERAQVAFFIASSHAKLQAFDKAIPFYKKALALGSKEPSLNYDLGQAYFATQKLEDAEAQFKKSIVGKFKMPASAYYVGYIRQIKEDREGAKDFYKRIQKIKNDEDHVKQPALFQIAEIEFDHFNEEKDKDKRLTHMEKDVLPFYKIARDFDPKSSTAEQADKKIAELEKEISDVRDRMVNGNPMPKQAYTLRLSQSFTYDTNVTTEAEGALVQVSDKDAFISKTGVLAKYQFNIKKRVSLIPEFNGSVTYHSRRSTPKVYQNDNILISPALRSKFEHMSGGKAATALFDIEFSLMLRDYQQAHQWPYYTRSWNFVLGERVTWFATGSTTIKASVKFGENYNPDRNSITPQISLGQNVKIFGSYDLQNTLTADYLRARDDANDERNYKLAQSVTISKLFEKVDFTPSLTLALKDTVKQKGSRGNEFSYNPAIGLSRNFGEKLEGTFDYSFTKNFSKAKDTYQYNKHEVKLGVTYPF